MDALNTKKTTETRLRVGKAPVGDDAINTHAQTKSWVYLKLGFKDPDGNIRYFPKAFDVEIVFGDNTERKPKKTKDNGLLQFKFSSENAKKFKFFRLHFISSNNNHLICVRKDDEASDPIFGSPVEADEFGSPVEADEEAKKGKMSFSLPPKWSMLTSEWAVSADEKIYNNAEKEKKFFLTENDQPRSIGTLDNPLEVILDPHWQFVKYEFFDRYYGHSDHKDKPISIPAVTVEGLVNDAEITRSNWTIPGDDKNQIIQCVPWILQAKEDGTPEPAPNKDSLLQFKQPKDTFIYSRSGTEREVSSDVIDLWLEPHAGRLKYYDLPELWQSKNYWSRLSDNPLDQGFFEKMADKPTTKSKPLIFSLDDIVLTDDQIAPIEMRDTDKVVLFYHEFLAPGSGQNNKGSGGRAGAKYYKNGLYKPGLNVAEAKVAAVAKVDDDNISPGLVFKNDDEMDAFIARLEKEKAKASELADAPLQAKRKAIDKQFDIEYAEAEKRGKEKAEKEIIEEAELIRFFNKNKPEDEIFAEAKAEVDKKNYIKEELDKIENDPVAQQRLDNAGIEAESAAKAFPYSDVLRHEEVPNYITDYPHWTRLVVSNGNLFDNFDKRTKSGNVIGARAAVRLVDSTSSGPWKIKPRQEFEVRPEALPEKKQDAAFFIIQPYFEDECFTRSLADLPDYTERSKGFYNEWKTPASTADFSKVGRNVVALLRTSNYENTNEENVVFLYHPVSFNFTAQKNDLNPSGPQPPNIDDQRTKWLETFTTTCADRWNGNDSVNDSRAWIVEDKTEAPKLRSQVVTFIQNVGMTQAHIEVQIAQKGERSAINTIFGTCSLDQYDGEADPKGSFAGAHEFGHAGGQFDDYADDCMEQTGFASNHTMGTPHILDTNAMMYSEKQLRARNFWYLTEWLRSLKPFKYKKFTVEHNGYSYKVPHYNHDNPGRNYAYWNVKGQVFYQPTPANSPEYYDAFLYFLGNDEYNQTVLSNKPDGIMVVMVKLLFNFDALDNHLTGNDAEKKKQRETIIKVIFAKINSKINKALNKKARVYAEFSIDGIDRGTSKTFERCMLHFSPRFELTPPVSQDPAVTPPELPAHLRIQIKPLTPPKPPDKTNVPLADPQNTKTFVTDLDPDSANPVLGAELDLKDIYEAITTGLTNPDAMVKEIIKGNEAEFRPANEIPELKLLFDIYYWFKDEKNILNKVTLRELYEHAIEGKIKRTTQVMGPGSGDWKNADQILQLLPGFEFVEKMPEAKFDPKSEPRTLELPFSVLSEDSTKLGTVASQFADIVFKHFCQMLGLSDNKDAALSDSYKNPNAYKKIVKACVNDAALEVKIRRQ